MNVETGMLEQFLYQPVIVETQAGPVVGVLAATTTSPCGGAGSLLVYAFIGTWVLVRDWICIKTARDST